MSSSRAKKISIYLPTEHVGALASRAEAEGVSLSAAAAQQIERGLFQSERLEHTQALEGIRRRLDGLQSDFRSSEEKQLGRLEKLVAMINKALEVKQ